MEIVERASATIGQADLEEMIEDAMKAKGFKITAGLTNPALTGITLELEMVRLTPDEKEVARRAKISQTLKNGGGVGKDQQQKAKGGGVP